MVLKLYGSELSTSTKFVALILKEKNVPFEFHSIDFYKAEHKAPAFCEKQPFGQVPYIDDDGFILFESRAICRYIEMKYKGQGINLVPSESDVKARALFEQAASIEAYHIDANVYKVSSEGIYKVWAGRESEVDKVVLEALIATLNERIDVYDKILAKQKYAAGDELTMVDLFHIPNFHLLKKELNWDYISQKPNVSRWWDEISSRPSWLAVKDGPTPGLN